MYLKNEKKHAGWCRTMQLLVWTLLILVQAAAVLLLEVRAETRSGELRQVEQSGELRQVEQEVWFESVEAADGIPQQIEAEAEVNGDTVTVACDLAEQEEEARFWQEDFVLPVTFHVYDADYYLLGSCRVPADHAAPRLQGYEDELLAEAGLEPENYRIDEICWEGEAYVDAEGELCRDALARGGRLMRSVRARYVGTVRVADPPEPVMEAAETTMAAEPEHEEAEETVSQPAEDEVKIVISESQTAPETTASGSGEQKKLPLSGWLLRMTQTLLVAIGIGAALFLTGLALLAGLHMAKCLRLWYINRRNKK